MADTHAKQPMRTLANDDVQVQLADEAGALLSTVIDEDGDIPGGVTSSLKSVSLNYGHDGLSWKRLATVGSGNMQVDILTAPLPAGAATEATLGSVDGKITTETDDDSLAGADTHVSTITLGYGWNGATWNRLTTDALTNSLLVSWDATSAFAVEMLAQGATLDAILTQLGGTGGTAVSDFKSDALGGTASATHTYTSTPGGKLQSVVCSSSTAARYEVKVGVAASEVTKFVAFTSESSPTVTIDCSDFAIAATDNVLVVKKNLAAAATVLELYSTININE